MAILWKNPKHAAFIEEALPPMSQKKNRKIRNLLQGPGRMFTLAPPENVSYRRVLRGKKTVGRVYKSLNMLWQLQIGTYTYGDPQATPEEALIEGTRAFNQYRDPEDAIRVAQKRTREQYAESDRRIDEGWERRYDRYEKVNGRWYTVRADQEDLFDNPIEPSQETREQAKRMAQALRQDPPEVSIITDLRR